MVATSRSLVSAASAEPAADAAASAAALGGIGRRALGLDGARALAVLGMILVNMKGQLLLTDREETGLGLLADWTEGKAAALFVVLAGVGIALRARGDEHGEARADLLRRSVALFGVGLLHVHFWQWDILHFYGLYLFAAAWLLRRSDAALVATGVAATSFGIALHRLLPGVNEPLDPWTGAGLIDDLFWHGIHPFFPWFAFIVIGMWLGRRPLHEAKARRRLMAGGATVWLCGELVDWVSSETDWLDGGAFGEEVWGLELLNPWPRPGSPLFVMVAGALAVVVICACLELEARGRFWSGMGLPLVATGQLALTCYIAHALTILLMVQHDILLDASLEAIWLGGFAMFASFVLASWWWRRRHPQGPLEMLLRQMSASVPASPAKGLARAKDR